MAQLVDVLEDKLARLLVLPEELAEEGATDGVTLGHWAKHLDHLRQVVICLAVVLTLSWIKQEVPCDELEGHAGE